MKSRILYGLVGCVLILAFILAACSQAAPSPTPSASPAPTSSAAPKPASTPSPTATTATTPAAAAIVLKYSTWTPSGIAYSIGTEWGLRQIELRTQGRVKFQYFYSGSLAPAQEEFNAVRTGVADAAICYPPWTAGDLPLNTVTNLPTIAKDPWSACLAMTELVKMPEIQAELDKNNIMQLFPSMSTPYYFFGTKPINKLADIKGMKMVASGEAQVIVAALGATPVDMPSTDQYTALQKGTVDGEVYGYTGGSSYKHYEIIKYIYEANFGGLAYPIIMNKASYSKLPADVKGLIDSLQADYAKAYYVIFAVGVPGSTLGYDKLGRETFAANGVKIVSPSADDAAMMTKLAQEGSWKRWLDSMNKQGLAGQKVLDQWVALNAKYQKDLLNYNY